MMEVVKTYRPWAFKLVLAGQVVFLFFLVYRAVGDGGYFPAHEDEVINYCSAKVFSETGSVQAEGCIMEDVSKVGRMNWYGPGYSVLYGTLRSIFEDRGSMFIVAHFCFAVATALLILLYPGSLENRLLIASALVFTQQFAVYIFTYFPESFHLLTASGLIFLLLRLSGSSGEARKRWTYLFIGCVLLLTLFRVTTIFWLSALIPLGDDRKAVFRMAAVFLGGLTLTLIYMKIFTAPPFASEMQKLDRLYKLDILDFIGQTVSAAVRNAIVLLTSGAVGVYTLLSLFALGIWRWWMTRHKFLLAGLVVSTLLLLALVAYYSADPWYFLKQSAMLVPLLIAGIMIPEGQTWTKYAVVLILAGVFVFVWSDIERTIHERRAAAVRRGDFKDFEAALQELPSHISENTGVTILWCYNEYDFGGATEALLPFSTMSRKPILYTTNIILDQNVSQQVRFQRYHKLEVDYILSRQSLDLPEVQALHETGYYHFYRIINTKK